MIIDRRGSKPRWALHDPCIRADVIIGELARSAVVVPTQKQAIGDRGIDTGIVEPQNMACYANVTEGGRKIVRCVAVHSPGFSAAAASPSKLMAMTSVNNARPGRVTIHGVKNM